MRGVRFPFEEVPSKIFGRIYRPVAEVSFWSRRLRNWREIVAIVDTGADYTFLPRFYAADLGIDLKRDCRLQREKGVGGEETVFIYPKIKISFVGRRFTIPVGFLNRDDIPALLGRHKFLEKLKVVFYRHQTHFE